MQDLKQIDGFDISFHEKSKRIINIKIDDEILKDLYFRLKNLILRHSNINLLHVSQLQKV